MPEETQDITMSPGWLVMAFLSLINEIIDWLGILLNVTGVWAIVVFILNLITLFFILGWRMLSGQPLLGSKKQALWLILEHIPIVGDLIPGWLLFMMGTRKTKRKT